MIAGRDFWKGEVMVAEIELDNLDAAEIRARRLNAKERDNTQKGCTFKKIQIADGNSKIVLDQVVESENPLTKAGAT